MKNSRITKLAVSFLTILSLFVCSVSACTCAHNSANVENHCEPQSALHSHESENVNHSHSASTHSHESRNEREKLNASENLSTAFSLEECCCFQPAPRVFAKSETVKIEKRAAEISLNSAIDFQLTAPLIEIATFDSIAPVFLSDSFSNPKSPRAPPRS
jgi:hypothetical protein